MSEMNKKCMSAEVRRLPANALLMLTLILSGGLSANEFAQKRLLLLYSYHPTFPTSQQIYSGLVQGFDSDQPIIEIEYMDSKRLFDKQSQQNFLTQFQYKMGKRLPYDAVVTADDNALRFALSNQALLAGAPIFFLGVNNRAFANNQADDPNVTGVIEAVSMKETIQLAESIRPNMKQLNIVVDSTVTGQSDLTTLLLLQSNFPELSFNVIDLSTVSWEAMEAAILRLPADGVLLLLSAYTDRNNERLSFDDSLSIIINAARLPVLHLWEHGIGNGITGGVVISHRHQAVLVADMIKQYWQGKAVADMPILAEQFNLTVLDQRQLTRFQIAAKQIPENAEIRFQRPAFWHKYWIPAVVSFLVFIFLMGVILHLNLENKLRKTLSNSLADRERKLKTILDNLDANVYMKDAQGRYVFVNESVRRLFDKPVTDIVGKTDSELFEEETANIIAKYDLSVLHEGESIRVEQTYQLKNTGPKRIFQTTKLPLRDEENRIYALCGISVDVTHQKVYEQHLERLAHVDNLTGLPNRLVFTDRLTQLIEINKRNRKSISVLYMDLDGFKEINDNYGHDVGDRLLKQIGLRMKGVIRSSDTLARVGGDEFVALLVHDSERDEEYPLVNRIIDCIRKPIEIGQFLMSVTVSIGITRFPQQTEITEADQLIRQADQAMYIAKTKGRNQVHYFDERIERLSVERERCVQDVTRAISVNEFELYFQPKVDMFNGNIIGFEALIRWNHPEQGLLMPGAFLPKLENNTVQYEVDYWVLIAALHQIERWRKQGLHYRISINVTNLQILQGHLTRLLQGVNGDRYQTLLTSLEVEILESQSINNIGSAQQIMSECQKLGICFSLDDFGTGYSSLNYLKKLPIKTLKVDRSFVKDILSNEGDQAILVGIKEFSRVFNLDIVLEGVETQEQCQKLLSMGFSTLQGYYLAKPMPVSVAEKWIVEWQGTFRSVLKNQR